MSVVSRFRCGLLAAMTFVLSGTAASASELGWYYGLGAGQSHADIVKSELDDLATFVISTAGPPVTSNSTLSDSKTSWSLFFGYQFSQYFAFEAGYLNFGSFPYRYNGTVDLTGTGAGIAPSSFDYTFDFKGYPLSAIGYLPLGPVFDVHARVGLLLANSKEKFAASAGVARIGDSLSASSQDLFYGAGAGMNLGENWSLTLDWVKYDKVGDGDIVAETDLDALSLSVIYRFGPL